MAQVARDIDVDLERLRYWVRVGLVRVYRSGRALYVRRVDEPWVRQLALLVSLGVSVEALSDAAYRFRLPALLEEIAGATDSIDVPSWLR